MIARSRAILHFTLPHQSGGAAIPFLARCRLLSSKPAPAPTPALTAATAASTADYDDFYRASSENITQPALSESAMYEMVTYDRYKAGDLDSARAVFDEMKLRGFVPDRGTYEHLAELYGRKGDVAAVESLLAEMVSTLKSEAEAKAANDPTAAEANEREHPQENNIVHSNSNPSSTSVGISVVGYNARIDALVISGRAQDAVQVLAEMDAAGIKRDGTLNNSLVTMYARLGDAEGAAAVHATMRHEKQLIRPETYHDLVCVHGAVGDIRAVRAVLDEMRVMGVSGHRDTYHAIIEAHANAMSPHGADLAFKELKRVGHMPTTETFHGLIRAHTSIDNIREAARYMQESVDRYGMFPKLASYRLVYGLYFQMVAKDISQTMEELRMWTKPWLAWLLPWWYRAPSRLPEWSESDEAAWNPDALTTAQGKDKLSKRIRWGPAAEYDHEKKIDRQERAAAAAALLGANSSLPSPASPLQLTSGNQLGEPLRQLSAPSSVDDHDHALALSSSSSSTLVPAFNQSQHQQGSTGLVTIQPDADALQPQQPQPRLNLAQFQPKLTSSMLNQFEAKRQSDAIKQYQDYVEWTPDQEMDREEQEKAEKRKALAATKSILQKIFVDPDADKEDRGGFIRKR